MSPRLTSQPLGAVGEPEGQTDVGGLQAPWIVASSTSVRVLTRHEAPGGGTPDDADDGEDDALWKCWWIGSPVWTCTKTR